MRFYFIVVSILLTVGVKKVAFGAECKNVFISISKKTDQQETIAFKHFLTSLSRLPDRQVQDTYYFPNNLEFSLSVITRRGNGSTPIYFQIEKIFKNPEGKWMVSIIPEKMTALAEAALLTRYKNVIPVSDIEFSNPISVRKIATENQKKDIIEKLLGSLESGKNLKFQYSDNYEPNGFRWVKGRMVEDSTIPMNHLLSLFVTIEKTDGSREKILVSGIDHATLQ